MRDHGKLPATMESPDIEALVDELMDLADLRAAADADVAEGLIQLMERQAYNHVPLPDGIAGRIQDWVGRVWSDDDPDLDDALCTVMANARTAEGRQLLENAARSPNPRVRDLAAETLRDVERSTGTVAGSAGATTDDGDRPACPAREPATPGRQGPELRRSAARGRPVDRGAGGSAPGLAGHPGACRPGEGIVLGREQPDHLDLARDLLDLRPGIGAVPHRPGVDLLLAQVESR